MKNGIKDTLYTARLWAHWIGLAPLAPPAPVATFWEALSRRDKVFSIADIDHALQL